MSKNIFDSLIKTSSELFFSESQQYLAGLIDEHLCAKQMLIFQKYYALYFWTAYNEKILFTAILMLYYTYVHTRTYTIVLRGHVHLNPKEFAVYILFLIFMYKLCVVSGVCCNCYCYYWYIDSIRLSLLKDTPQNAEIACKCVWLFSFVYSNKYIHPMCMHVLECLRK